MEIKNITVLGSGIMGHGIAQVSAMAGYNVVLRDIEQKFLDKAMEKIKWSLDKLVSKEKISEIECELSNDKSCSWMEVECLGACVNAPMMQINDDYYEDLDKQKTLDILDKILNGETPKPGSYRGRVNNEPENNRKTLMDLKNA